MGEVIKKKEAPKELTKEKNAENYPTLQISNEKDIALDFAAKAYKRFDKVIKSIILFGSQTKNTAVAGSDIDIIMLLDDASVRFDQEFIAWYREELRRIVEGNPYQKSLHVNSVKITTWWDDVLKGDPVVINILRYGEAVLDFGGFFSPLKILLQQGKIKSTPEAIYTALQRAPIHLARSRASKLSSIEGLYWAMVDSAHAAIMAAKQTPASPEHVPIMLKDLFVDPKYLKMNYVVWYRDLFMLHKKISHGEQTEIEGSEIDLWQERTDEFVRVMAELVKKLIS